MTAKHNEAHRDSAKIPGLTDEERRAITAKLEVAKANSPKVRIL